MRSDSLQGIIPFVQVVEAGSFTLAAERLNLTTSAVGKSVSRLEGRLGVRLLNRSTRSLSLTGEGDLYFRACKDALAGIDAAHAQLESHSRAPSGTLRIDLPLAFGRRCVAPILFEIARENPQLTIEASFNDRRVDVIEEGFDLVIRVGELGNEAGLVSRKLLVWRSVLCATPSYLASAGVPRDLGDLNQHRLIVYGRSGSIYPWTLKINDETKTVIPRGTLVLGHGEPMLDAALLGLGIAYLPTWLSNEHLRTGDLVAVWPECGAENMPVYALWPKSRSPAPKIRLVVDTLAARLSRPTWEDD